MALTLRLTAAEPVDDPVDAEVEYVVDRYADALRRLGDW